MLTLLAGMAIGLLPLEVVTRDKCDTFEINVVVDGEGNETFRQFLIWRWDAIQDWRIVKSPPLIYGNKILVRDEGNLRRIDAHEVRIRYSQYDVELEDRQRWPREMRYPLTNPAEIKKLRTPTKPGRK